MFQGIRHLTARANILTPGNETSLPQRVGYYLPNP
jgi:hypothetical protein